MADKEDLYKDAPRLGSGPAFDAMSDSKKVKDSWTEILDFLREEFPDVFSYHKGGALKYMQDLLKKKGYKSLEGDEKPKLSEESQKMNEGLSEDDDDYITLSDKKMKQKPEKGSEDYWTDIYNKEIKGKKCFY